MSNGWQSQNIAVYRFTIYRIITTFEPQSLAALPGVGFVREKEILYSNWSAREKQRVDRGHQRGHEIKALFGDITGSIDNKPACNVGFIKQRWIHMATSRPVLCHSIVYFLDKRTWKTRQYSLQKHLEPQATESINRSTRAQHTMHCELITGEVCWKGVGRDK